MPVTAGIVGSLIGKVVASSAHAREINAIVAGARHNSRLNKIMWGASPRRSSVNHRAGL